MQTRLATRLRMVTDFTFDQTNETTTFKHANAPVVTLGGGSWVGNVYQIQIGQSLSVQSTVNDDANAFFMYGWIDLIDSNEINSYYFHGGPVELNLVIWSQWYVPYWY